MRKSYKDVVVEMGVYAAGCWAQDLARDLPDDYKSVIKTPWKKKPAVTLTENGSVVVDAPVEIFCESGRHELVVTIGMFSSGPRRICVSEGGHITWAASPSVRQDLGLGDTFRLGVRRKFSR